jgi:hypothetical protein
LLSNQLGVVAGFNGVKNSHFLYVNFQAKCPAAIERRCDVAIKFFVSGKGFGGTVRKAFLYGVVFLTKTVQYASFHYASR